jgi:hypothetical protein
LDVNLDFPVFDSTDFTSPPGYVSPTTWIEWIKANSTVRFLAKSRGAASVRIGKGKTAVRTFSDFQARVEAAGGFIRVPSWQMSFADGLVTGNAVFDIREETTTPFGVSFQGEKLKFERIFSNGDEGMRIQGEFFAEGKFDWRASGKRENQGVNRVGSVEIRARHGIVRRFEILSKIFSLVNLGSLLRGRLPDLGADGFPFRTGSLSMEAFDAKWKIKDLKLASDAAGITASGMYFSDQERIDFKVDVAPLVGLDTLVSGLFGNLFTKDGKTLGAVFRVRGLYGTPDVRLEPFDPLRNDEHSRR